jgi:hypothetical protein
VSDQKNVWKYVEKDGSESTIGIRVKYELTGSDAMTRDSELMAYYRQARAHYKGPFLIDPEALDALYNAAWWKGFERGSAKQPAVATTASVEVEQKKTKRAKP